MIEHVAKIEEALTKASQLKRTLDPQLEREALAIRLDCLFQEVQGSYDSVSLDIRNRVGRAEELLQAQVATEVASLQTAFGLGENVIAQIKALILPNSRQTESIKEVRALTNQRSLSGCENLLMAIEKLTALEVETTASTEKPIVEADLKPSETAAPNENQNPGEGSSEPQTVIMGNENPPVTTEPIAEPQEAGEPMLNEAIGSSSDSAEKQGAEIENA